MFRSNKEDAVESTPYTGTLWEYHVQDMWEHSNAAKTAETLTALGQQGWELAGVMDQALGVMARKQDSKYTLLFKRRSLAL